MVVEDISTIQRKQSEKGKIIQVNQIKTTWHVTFLAPLKTTTNLTVQVGNRVTEKE